MEFIEAPAFTRNLTTYLDDEGYRRLQASLVDNPEAGRVIPETGGFRKVRWPDQRRGKGKRGGLRIIYYHFSGEARIWLVTLYDKEQADDLTPAQKKVLRGAINVERAARTIAKKARF